jgi:hypothetical protein
MISSGAILPNMSRTIIMHELGIPFLVSQYPEGCFLLLLNFQQEDSEGIQPPWYVDIA